MVAWWHHSTWYYKLIVQCMLFIKCTYSHQVCLTLWVLDVFCPYVFLMFIQVTNPSIGVLVITNLNLVVLCRAMILLLCYHGMSGGNLRWTKMTQILISRCFLYIQIFEPNLIIPLLGSMPEACRESLMVIITWYLVG